MQNSIRTIQIGSLRQELALQQNRVRNIHIGKRENPEGKE